MSNKLPRFLSWGDLTFEIGGKMIDCIDDRLLSMNLKSFKDCFSRSEEIFDFFEKCNVAWVHNGDMKMPHAKLSSDLCSNGYFDCRKLLKFPLICEVMALRLYEKIDWYRRFGSVAIYQTIGSPYSAITFSYEFAKLCRSTHAFAEKDPKDHDGKKMIFKGDPIGPEKAVLQVEELITTNRSWLEVRRAVQAANLTRVNFLPVVACIVHRPPKLECPSIYDGVEVISLVEKEVWAVPQDKCHLCAAGSKRIEPRGNWAELTGRSIS